MNENQSRFTNPRLNQIFDLEQLPSVTLEINVSDWNSLLMAFDQNPDQNFWVPGNFVFTGNRHLPDQTIPNVGLRVRGNSSRNRPEGNEGQPHNPNNPVWRQASFALQFGRYNSGQTSEGLSRIDLKFVREDPTRIREVYAFDLYQQAGLDSGPLISMCQFFIRIVGGSNNPAYFGIYKLKEFVDEDYLENRKTFFGDNSPGSRTPFLWKGDPGAALNNYDPSVIENRDIYDLRTNTSSRTQANAQLTDFVRNLVNLEGDNLKNWANQTMDVPLLLKTYMANIICGNMDDYWFNANNFGFYFNTHGKFFFIPNDFDTTLGTGWGIDAARQDLLDWGNPGHPLIRKLVNGGSFFQEYLNAFYDLTYYQTGPFHVDRSIARITKWQELIMPHLADETIHFGCHNDGAGCVIGQQGNNSQTPFEDRTAWWSSGGNNANYRLLERGANNFFEQSGFSGRAPQINPLP